MARNTKPPKDHDDSPVTAKELMNVFSFAPPPTPKPAPSEVDATTVQETILGAIADLHQKRNVGEFSKDDAVTLEKLIGLAKDFVAIARAVDELAGYSRAAEAAAAAEKPKDTQETIGRLRAVMGTTPKA